MQAHELLFEGKAGVPMG